MISKVSKQKMWILKGLKDRITPRCAHDVAWDYYNKDEEMGGRDGGNIPTKSCYSSFYRSLNQMEKDGFVERHNIKMGYINEVGRHIKDGYIITELGKKYLSVTDHRV